MTSAVIMERSTTLYYILSLVLLVFPSPGTTQTCVDNFNEACLRFINGHNYLCYDDLIREVRVP